MTGGDESGEARFRDLAMDHRTGTLVALDGCARRRGDGDAMHRVLDAPLSELLWDFPADQGSNLLPSFTCRYYRGLTGDRPAWILPYLCEQGQFNMQPPRLECDCAK